MRPLYPAAPGAEVLAWPALEAEMSGGYRLDVSDPAAGGKARFLMLLAPGGTIESSTPMSGAGTIGVSVAFSDGTSVEVVFGEDQAGGTLKLTAGGSTVFDGPLPETIGTLPLLDK